jgi:hypothetical protein
MGDALIYIKKIICIPLMISLYEQVNFKKIGAKQLKYIRNVHSKYVFLFAEKWS